MKKLLIVSVVFLFLLGCTTTKTVWKSTPEIPVLQKEMYSISLKAICGKGHWGCTGFIFRIQNNLDKEIQIDWNKTLFIENGQTNGNFIYPGIMYMQRHSPRTNDVIMAKGRFEKQIKPTNHVYYSEGWGNRRWKQGNYGVYFTFIIDGQEVHEKVMMDVTKEKITTKVF